MHVVSAAWWYSEHLPPELPASRDQNNSHPTTRTHNSHPKNKEMIFNIRLFENIYSFTLIQATSLLFLDKVFSSANVINLISLFNIHPCENIYILTLGFLAIFYK